MQTDERQTRSLAQGSKSSQQPPFLQTRLGARDRLGLACTVPRVIPSTPPSSCYDSHRTDEETGAETLCDVLQFDLITCAGTA